MGLLGVAGTSWLPYLDWLLPGLVALLALALAILYKKALRSGYYAPFILSLSGALILLVGRRYAPATGWIPLTGALLVAAGSALEPLLSFATLGVPPVSTSNRCSYADQSENPPRPC